MAQTRQKGQELLSIQIIEELAEIVREIYNLAIDGWGGKRIAVHLTSRGIPPPGAKKIWRESTIRNWFVARSPEGILRATWKTRRTTKDYTIPDYYPVIINPKTAKLAHANRRKSTGRPARSEAEGNIWRGIKTRARDATTEPDGHWMRWQGTANRTQDPETGKRKTHNLCALSDTDRHSILNVLTRVLERLVSIAVANAVGV